MLRPAALTLALSATLAPTTLRSQAPDTAAVRAAYARVVAFRDSMEQALVRDAIELLGVVHKRQLSKGGVR